MEQAGSNNEKKLEVENLFGLSLKDIMDIQVYYLRLKLVLAQIPNAVHNRVKFFFVCFSFLILTLSFNITSDKVL